MPSNRDSLFPSASIGRAGSSQIQRVASHESLNAHPLLSPNTPSSPSNSGLSPDTSSGTAPRYVPYTPRHRPPPSSATTGMTTHSSMPVASHQHQQGGATSKLQLQNLKAAAQGIGLGNGTVGWAILEKLVEGDTGSEWDEIWATITTAKPTLLLPLEPFSGEVVTPELVKDHVAFCSGLSSTPLVTFSGLRGSISNSTLTIQSTLPVTSKHFRDLLTPDSQSSALMSLPPLPSPHLPSTSLLLPSYALPGSTLLPLPPRFHISKPPLPHRPSSSSSTPPKPNNAPRISNPFASIFGRPPASSAASSPSPSQTSLPSEDAHSASMSIEIAACAVGKKIVKKSVGKELSRLIKEDIKGDLADCPTWVVDRVIDFTGPLFPIPKSSKRIDVRRNTSGFRSSNSRQRVPILSAPTLPPADPSALADAFQSFYASLEDDLRATPAGSPLVGRRKEETVTTRFPDDSTIPEISTADKSKENELLGKQENETEVRIKKILDQVESVTCSVFYDRTFRPLSGDDASHDDALASRIAALNMLDLSLEHLGVEVPNETVRGGIDGVLKACGETLQRLEDPEHRAPGRKSALLVEAHKQIVDGLGCLPQLRLKPEHESEVLDEKTPRASSFGMQATQDASVSPPHDPAQLASEDSLKPELTPETQENVLHVDLVSSPGAGILAIPLSDGNTSESNPNMSEHAEKPPDILEYHASEVPADDTTGLPNPPPHPPPSSSHTQGSRPSTPTTVSGDLLFPLLIFSVVKANPTHLVSHLLYTQRFRSRSIGGQESYCLINLMAVVEFLEHVDMGALGLGESERVMSTADLTPIPLAHGLIDSGARPSSPLSTRLGKRVNQQVEELAGLAGSANKVITGVVDSSFGVLRGFLTSNPDLSTPHSEPQDSAPWNTVRPGFGLLRRGSGFSIAGVAASLPGSGRPKTPAGGAEEGQQLIEVSSRPGSIKEADLEGEEDDENTSTTSAESSEESPDGEIPDRNDARSVRSFSSMLSESRERERDRDRDRAEGKERMSLTDRLANMSVKLSASPGEQHGAKASPPSSRPTSRPSSWLPSPAPAATSMQSDTPVLSGTTSPPHPKIRIPSPNRRFLECAEQDIRVGEVGELLREYRRMVQALRSTGAFEDNS